MSKAPDTGAFSAPSIQPAITLNRPQQGTNEVADCSVERIGRMIQELYPNEQQIKAAEDTGDKSAVRAAKAARDEHVAELRHVMDYAVNVNAFETKPCPTCRLPMGAAEFVRAVPEFEKPAIQCPTCTGLGTVQVKRTDKATAAAVKRINYWSKILDDYLRCCKIRAGNAESSQAYLELESEHVKLLKKFGSENQTSLEGADAEQGVRQGFIDAAIRFDPMRTEGATFGTVAYNWCRRNSRARHNGQKRAGVYAPSIDAEDHEGRSKVSMVMSSDGALASFSPPDSMSPSLVLDLRDQVNLLPENQRAVIEYELAGMTPAAMASKLGVSRSTVRKLKEAAFTSLRSGLSAYATALHD